MTPVWILAALLGGCQTDGRSGAETPPPDVARVCTEPSPLQLRRLSHEQYENTVWAAAELLGDEPLVLALNDALPPLLDSVPSDTTDAGLSREDQAVSQAHADAWYAVAELVADTAVAPEHRTTVFDGCLEASCVEGVVAPLLSRLHRRPLNAEELDFYVGEVYPAAPTHLDGLRDVVLVALASPWFVHQVEHGDGVADGPLVALTAHEVASRLAYHFWSAPPDDELWTLAEDGSLLDDVTYRAQVERVFADRRTEGQVDRFFSEWLQLDEIAAMDQLVGDPRFDAFAGAHAPSPQLTADLQEDALGLVRWHVAHGGTLDDLWQSDLNTTPSPEVAALYGDVPVWDGVSPPEPLGTGVHAGLLTRPALTASGLPSTRPIHKGVLVRRRILCDQLGAPPADIGEEPDIDPLSSTRERTEALTEVEGSSCSACHTYINGLGYVSESFDGLGRYRQVEPILDEDGTVLAEVPVETAAIPRVDVTSEAEVADAIGLAAVLADSDKPAACFARYLYRHTYSHVEDDALDGCTLDAVSDTLGAGRPLAEALRAIALDPMFRVRRLDDAPATGGSR